jgi:hypothetical protein
VRAGAAVRRTREDKALGAIKAPVAGTCYTAGMVAPQEPVKNCDPRTVTRVGPRACGRERVGKMLAVAYGGRDVRRPYAVGPAMINAPSSKEERLNERKSIPDV